MLKSGFARVDVTAPFGSNLAGYFEARYADGILEPIYLNAIALENNEERVVIITADFTGICEEYSTLIRRRIEKKLGIPAENIMVTALHQHTSVALRNATNHSVLQNNVMSDYAYLDFLYRKFEDVAQMAIDDMSESVMYYGERETAKPLSFVRRYIMSDGTIATNPSPKKNPDNWPPVSSADWADNTVRLIKLSREGKKDIAFVNFGTHPDTIGGTKYSADWPGFVRNFVEAEHENTHCFFLNGFQGDVNCSNFMLPKEERPVKHGAYPASPMYIARTVVDAVNLLWNDLSKINDTTLGAKTEYIYNKSRTDKMEFYDECRALWDARVADPDNPPNKTASGIDMVEALRIIRTKESPLYRKLPVMAIRIGEVAIVGLGGEPFTHYGTAIRENFPGKNIITSCCANGYQGYLPTAKAFEQGGYEALNSHFTPTLEDECVDMATELLKQLEF